MSRYDYSDLPGVVAVVLGAPDRVGGAAGARIRGVAAMKKRERKPIPALLLTDATVDRFIAQAAAGRAAVTIREIMRAMGVADGDATDAEARATVWLRLHGEALLPGLLGRVQRANALRLMSGGDPLSGREIEGVIRRHAPGASAALVDDVLSRFAEHLHNEGARLAAEADALERWPR